MRLLEAWKNSSLPYKEVVYHSLAEEKGRMWWGALGRGQHESESHNDFELTKNALRIAKWDKTIVSLFNVIAAVIPFMIQFFGISSFGLTSAISLSLIITFGFTALYAIQTFTSFVSSESSALLSILPLKETDFSLIILFSFVRSVDYIVIGSILSQVILVAYFFISPLAVLVMFVASVANSILAVAVALWFSRVFVKNLAQGGRSKSSTFFRIFFILMWGSLLMGVSLLISLPFYIVPSLELTLVNSNQFYSLLFSLLHPFSAGLTIASINQSIYSVSKTIIATVCFIAHVIIAAFAGKWTLTTVKRISNGNDIKISRIIAKDFSIKKHIPLLGYILKDLKISSRTPGTAFFFALPVLETIIVSFIIASFDILRASNILISTFMAGTFVLFMPLALLNAEGKGLVFTKTLPLKINMILIAKTLISTSIYAPVPLVLLAMILLKPITSSIIMLIPIITILAIASASIFEIQLFLNYVKKGKISAIVHDLKKLFVGIVTLILPLALYSFVYLVSSNHIFAVFSMITCSLIEFSLAIYLLKSNNK